MGKRADVRDQTRDRIVQATMQLHDEKGVAPTTFSEVAERAGVGVATVFRHFPKQGDLVRACGAHVWQQMRPPVAEAAATVFSDANTPRERLQRLVEELDGFYERGALRLALASRDRDLVPELDQFLGAVEAGVEAMVREALRNTTAPPGAVEVAIALMSFPVWVTFSRLGLPTSKLTRLRTNLLECGIKAAGSII